MEKFQVRAANQNDFMGKDKLLSKLFRTLVSDQRSEAMRDGDAAVAKTDAIKNIQKALTARILKRLDDGQPLVNKGSQVYRSVFNNLFSSDDTNI